jgi:transcriptional regulator with XRE-family HTH domain
MNRLAQNLRAIRTHMGYTQAVMASALNVTRSSYSGYENGTAEPSLDTLLTIQGRFQISADILLTHDLSTLSPRQWHQCKQDMKPVTLTTI